MLPVVLIVAIIEKVLKAAGLQINIVDKFIEKFSLIYGKIRNVKSKTKVVPTLIEGTDKLFP